MLTGRAAFAGDTVVGHDCRHSRPRAGVGHLAAETPADVRRLLQRCLEKIRSAAFAISAMHSSNSTTTRRRRFPFETAVAETAAWSRRRRCVLGALAVAGYAISRAPTPPGVARFHVLPPAEGAHQRCRAFRGWPSSGIRGRGADRQRRLWVRPTDSLEARALEGTEGAGSPFWSPDGRFIAFFAQGKLRKIASGGGAPQVLCDAADGTGGGTWSPAGTILFARSPTAACTRCRPTEETRRR